MKCWLGESAVGIQGERSTRVENPLGYKKELAEFGWWSISHHFEPEWVLEQLIVVLRTIGSVDAGHQVVKRLAETADTRPKAVLDVSAIMLQSDKDGWLVLSWRDSVTDILRSALSSPETDVRSLATDVTQQLGAGGYRDFVCFCSRRRRKETKRESQRRDDGSAWGTHPRLLFVEPGQCLAAQMRPQPAVDPLPRSSRHGVGYPRLHEAVGSGKGLGLR